MNPVVLSSSIPDECIRPFVDAASEGDLAITVDRRPGDESYAGLEWYLPTAVVLYLSAPYFDGLLGELGKQHYRAIRQGIVSLWSTLFGSDRTVRIRVFASGSSKVDPNPEYSRGLSVMARTGGGKIYKLLLRDAASREELDASISSFLDFFTCVNAGVLHDGMSVYEPDLRPSSGMVLLSYDPAAERIYIVESRTHRHIAGEETSSSAAEESSGKGHSKAINFGVLPYEQILSVREAAIRAELVHSREALLAGIHPQFRASLPLSRVPGEQILQDLSALNFVGRLRDGSIPLEAWLSTAVALATLRHEGAVLKEALEAVRKFRQGEDS